MTPNWLDKNEYPFTSKYFPINGHKLHYIDEGSGEVILFIHGTPSWSFDFRHIIKFLKTQYRCIAVDHMGFGLSDKPEHYDYSTMNHSGTLQAFVNYLQLTEINLVMHDFGGPIGFAFANRQPDKVNRLVIMNSWLWSSEHDADFIRFKKVLKSPLLPFLYKYLNFSARYLMPASFGDKKLSRHLRRQFSKPFGKPSERNGCLFFAKSLLNDQDWFESLWTDSQVLKSKPALLIWGMQDAFAGAAYLQKFASGFPDARRFELPSCGHFPQEEEPEKVTLYLKQFLEEHA